MAGIEDLYRKSGGGSGNFNPLVDFMGVVKEFTVKDLGKDNLADTLTFTHMSDAMGKLAGEEDVIRLAAPKTAAVKGAKPRPSLGVLAKGDSRMDPAKPGTVLHFDKCVRAADGVIEANWARTWAKSPEEPTIFVMPGVLTKVYPVSIDKDGKRKPYQNAVVCDAPRALRVGGVSLVEGETVLTLAELGEGKGDDLAGKPMAASFEDAFAHIIGTAQPAGDAGFLLRAIVPGEIKPADVTFMQQSKKVKNEAGEDVYVKETVEERMAAFKKEQPRWYELVTTNKDIFFEMVPLVRAKFGPNSVERAATYVIAEMEKGVKYPKDRLGALYQGEVTDPKGKVGNKACFVESDVVMRRVNEDSDFWFVTDAGPRIPYGGAKFDDGKVVTANIPASMAATFTDEAKEVGKPKRKEAAAPAAEAGNFGDPETENDATRAPGGPR